MRYAPIAILALLFVPFASAKGFTHVVLVGADGRSASITGREATIEGLISVPGAHERIRSGYVRMFFVGPGGFPANPARYYPAQGCVLLEWGGTSRTSCTRISDELVRLLHPASRLRRFHAQPTVLVRIHYVGRLRGLITTAAALDSPVELALDRPGRAAAHPRGCYAFTGRWHGPRAVRRPRRFELCARGVYAGGRLYPLQRGVWEWFRINVD